jgi:hypothetical protein
MKIEKRTEFLTRDGVMRLLADDERKSVKVAEKGTPLAPGEEYLDLEHLELGVRRGPSATTPRGDVLPKRAVRPATWSKIMALVGAALPYGAPLKDSVKP